MKKVLLIEDDNSLCENTKELLEWAHYEVDVASNGIKGVALALEKKFDIILCDIMMPEMDGFGVYEALSKNPKTRSIPFVFISAKSELTDIRKGMILGADDYITKPFTEKDLLHTIESRLAKHKVLNEITESQKHKNNNSTLQIPNLEALRIHAKSSGEFLKVPKRKCIYNENDHVNYVYFIEKGLVKTHTMDENGKELVVEIHKKKQFFGLCSFKDSKNHTETATALETCELYRISASRFETILKENHELTLEFVDFLSDKVYTLKQHLLKMAYASVLQKTVYTLLEFSEKLSDNPYDFVTVSRTDLAGAAGISTESFIRSLTQLKNEGLIDIDGRHITILNYRKLKNYIQ